MIRRALSDTIGLAALCAAFWALLHMPEIAQVLL
jgi:hypothetical protein